MNKAKGTGNGRSGKPPVWKIKTGVFEVAIFENMAEKQDGTTFMFPNVTLQKNIKDKEAETGWRKEIMHLRRDDITRVILALTRAQEEMFLKAPSRQDENTLINETE
jgi:hypothetical protein